MEELILLPSVLWAHAKRWAWAVSEGLYGGKWGSDVRNCMLTLFIGLLIWSAVSPESWQEDNRAPNKRVRRQNKKVLRGVRRLQALYRGRKARGAYKVGDSGGSDDDNDH
jgi:hypothetical protein